MNMTEIREQMVELNTNMKSRRAAVAIAKLELSNSQKKLEALVKEFPETAHELNIELPKKKGKGEGAESGGDDPEVTGDGGDGQ
jgi:hypothetical protein